MSVDINIFNYKIVADDKYFNIYYKDKLQKRYTYPELFRKAYMDDEEDKIFPQGFDISMQSIINSDHIHGDEMLYKFAFDYEQARASDIFKKHVLYEMVRISKQPSEEEMKQTLRSFLYKVNPHSEYEAYFSFGHKTNKFEMPPKVIQSKMESLSF